MLFNALPLFAGLEQYFKKAEGKSHHHTMRNIDFIYLLNLDQREEKLAKCLDQLKPYNIHPYRFSAVNGWELSLDTINDVGVKLTRGMNTTMMGTIYLTKDKGLARHEHVKTFGQIYFSHCMSRGAMGIVLSHLSILQDAYDSGYNTIWVMEDDIHVVKDPHLISYLIDQLDERVGPNNWDMMFTDPDTKDQKGNYVSCLGYALRPNYQPPDPMIFQARRYINPHFRRVGARYGVYSMIVRRSGMKKILDFFKTYKIFLPYDMDFFLAPDIKIYAIQKDVVSTIITAPSDNGGPNYLYKKN